MPGQTIVTLSAFQEAEVLAFCRAQPGWSGLPADQKRRVEETLRNFSQNGTVTARQAYLAMRLCEL
jgi:hypothetical protein